jgi:tRNA dimethylallyltransferase
MQMYTGLPIITNKITAEEQQGIPHHLLGIVSLHEEPWRVGVFKKKAEEVIDEIRGRGKLPILVGGTHYYTQSLLFGENLVSDDGEGNAEIHIPREEIDKRFPILEKPTEEILARLKEVDPIMADRWHPNDRRKIQRSLEIYLTTGKQASAVYEEQKERKNAVKSHELTEQSMDDQSLINSTILFWVHAESNVLRARLDNRVDKMVHNGLLEEVKSLGEVLYEQESNGIMVDRSRGIWVSIGFKEFETYLEAVRNGSTCGKDVNTLLSESVEQTKTATKQYSRRQVRWIRLKLLAALYGARAQQRLFLLDGSDVSQWSEVVSEPAITITGQFLEGEALPNPTEMSTVAMELLSPKQRYEFSDRPDLWIRKVCELCSMTAVTETQWELHLKSRSHRRAVKKTTKASPRNKQPCMPDEICTESDAP